MAKIFEPCNDTIDLAEDLFENTGLPQMGINIKVLATTKAKNVVKVSKANPTTQYLTSKDVIMVVYEEAFDRLTDDYKSKLMEGALSNVSYDDEKDKLNVESDIAKEMFAMRQKYSNYVDIMEASYLTISQIEEEEKEKKEQEKAAKAAKKKGN